jgi:hypothetical protein
MKPLFTRLQMILAGVLVIIVIMIATILLRPNTSGPFQPAPVSYAGVYQYGANMLELYSDGTFNWPSMFNSDTQGSYKVVGNVMVFDYYGGKHSEHPILTHSDEVLYFADGYQFRRIGPASH